MAIYALLCVAACASKPSSGGESTPTVPGNLTLTVLSATQINLSWTASTEKGGTISSYQIARCSGTNCSNFVQVGTSATTTFNDIGLTGSTSYAYEVRAVDTSNDAGPYSTAAAATTSAAVPTAPANLTLTVVSATQINLSWTASTETGGTISGYQIARCSGTNCSNFAQVGTSATTTFNDTGLAAATSYSYEVRAVDASNNTGPYSTSAAATTLTAPVPTAPGNLTLTVVSATQVNLSWTASTEAGGTISNYQIARCSGTNCSNFAQVGTSATTTFNNTGLTGSTSYTYEVRAVDASNNTGPYSTSATATTLAAPVPTAPGNLTLTVLSSTQISLSWTASTETGGTISGYQIARCSGTNCSNFAQVGTSATTTFNDTGLTGSTSYTYEVRAVDASNNTGPYSTSATATTLAAPVPTAPGNLTLTVVSATQINLSWTASTEAGGTISSYQIARCSGTNCSNFTQVGTSATTTFNDTGLTGSTSYTYEVRAVDASNNTGPYSTSATAATSAAVPTAPTNLVATAVSSSQINLSWTASTEAGGTISSYQIAQCSGTNCSNFTQVGTSATTTFNNTGLAVSTSYTYEVRAVDNLNNTGPYSSTAKATTMATGPSLLVLVVGPQNPVIADTAAVQAFTATGHYSDGSTQDLTASATWTSSNTGVATVNSSGSATSVALPGGQNAGFTSIKAVSAGVTGVSILSVTNHTSNTSGFAGVFTQHNDIARTGQNVNETALTSAAFPGTFGKKFSQPVDGFIYGQPLYVPQVMISGVKHNVIYVVTENDSVYAFDADSNGGANANPLWKVTLLDAAHGAGTGAMVTNSSTDNPCTDVIPTIGVTSTPVIDPSTGTMYVESKTKESGNFFHRLHALDITTGAEKVSPPATITATVSGIAFDPVMHTNRPGLLLLNGVVYVAYASDCDNAPYHGWIFAYGATTLAQLAVFNESPETSFAAKGGFWMSGAGIAADSSANIFIASGNGDFDTLNVPARLLGDTDMKLFMAGTSFSLEDYFTPFDQQSLADNDTDLGSGGVLLLPDQGGAHPQELVQVGKEGTIYVIDRNQMTKSNQHYCSGCASDTQIAQELQTEVGGMWSMPAYWNGNVYFGGSGDNLVAFSVTNGALGLAPTSASGTFFGFPGPTPSISALGTSGGILWAIDSTNYGAPDASLGPAVLHAYDATNLAATPLYDSSIVPGDHAGDAVKFTVPTIANGKVYIGTQTELDVYGP